VVDLHLQLIRFRVFIAIRFDLAIRSAAFSVQHNTNICSVGFAAQSAGQSERQSNSQALTIHPASYDLLREAPVMPTTIELNDTRLDYATIAAARAMSGLRLVLGK